MSYISNLISLIWWYNFKLGNESSRQEKTWYNYWVGASTDPRPCKAAFWIYGLPERWKWEWFRYDAGCKNARIHPFRVQSEVWSVKKSIWIKEEVSWWTAVQK